MNSLWESELKLTIKAIKTPLEVGNDERTSSMMDGVLEPDECDQVTLFAGIKRIKGYSFAVSSIYAEFIHLLMSSCQSLFVSAFPSMGKANYVRTFTWNTLAKLCGKGSYFDLSDIDGFDTLYKMILIWNFLKHSTEYSFCNLAKKYPNVVIKLFTAGVFPIEAVRLDDALKIVN